GSAIFSTPNSKLVGLTAMVDVDGSVDLFATTTIASNNSLVTVTDMSNGNSFGGMLSGTLTTIAMAGANYAFRGVQFAPVSLGTTLSIAATSASKAEGNSGTSRFTFTVTRNGESSGITTADYAVTGSGGNQADASDFGGTLPSG